jgi:hypothetical protein
VCACEKNEKEEIIIGGKKRKSKKEMEKGKK